MGKAAGLYSTSNLDATMQVASNGPRRVRRQSSISSTSVHLAVVISVGCAALDSGSLPDAGTARSERSSADSPGFQYFRLREESRIDLLAVEEMSYDGPHESVDGSEYIRIFTTASHAADVASRLRVDHELDLTRVPGSRRGGFDELTSPPCSGAPPTSSDFLKSLADIEAELAAIAAGHSGIRLLNLGTSQVDMRMMMGLQFGPLGEQVVDPVPTLVITGTIHAREWITTAVTLGIVRWLNDVVSSGPTGPESSLYAALLAGSVIVVPVANPDGYARTRTPGNRAWRGNINTATCPLGVDLNRNFRVAFNDVSVGTASSCSVSDPEEFYKGHSADSERETRNLAALFTGTAPGSASYRVVTLLAYHSWGDLLLYPDGFQGATSPSAGWRCRTGDSDSCFNPDFQVYRALFGDTLHLDLWLDEVTIPGVAHPFRRDHYKSLLYGVSGDTGLFLNYHPAAVSRGLSATPELPSLGNEFYVECVVDYESKLDQLARGQRPMLRRTIGALGTLETSTALAAAYAPNRIGELASGMMAREYGIDFNGTGVDSLDARATFVKPVWRPSNSGSMTARIDDVSYAYTPWRTGAQYDLYALPFNGAAYDPLNIPCHIESRVGNTVSDDAIPGCTGTLDLCDADRLSRFNFSLVSGVRGSHPDCWWEPTGPNAWLELGGGPAHANRTHCHMTFSVLWDGLSGSDDPIVVERLDSTGWTTLREIKESAPYNSAAQYPTARRLYSYAYEGHENLPASTQRFRISIGNDIPSTLQVFDPVIYCRGENLP